MVQRMRSNRLYQTSRRDAAIVSMARSKQKAREPSARIPGLFRTLASPLLVEVGPV